MALQKINIGAVPNDGTGDNNRAAWQKVNAAFTEVDSVNASLAGGTTAQYYRGDKTWRALNKAAVGLGNVDNTSDASKPISTATATALSAKQATLVSGTNIKTINGESLLGPGNIYVGLLGVELVPMQNFQDPTQAMKGGHLLTIDVSNY